MSNVIDIDIDEYSPDTRPVLYDPDFAKAQVMKMNAQQRDVLAAPPIPSAPPPTHPPEWKGCKHSFYCVRNCGSDGNHLKEDGSPGGRGQCRLRPPPEWYCPPVGQPTFDEAKRSKKRKHEDQYWGEPSHQQADQAAAAQAVQQAAAQAAAIQAAQQAAQQAAAQAVAIQAAQQAATQAAAIQAAQQAATQPSEMETLRNAIQRLQEENARLSQEVNGLTRMFAAFMPSPP